MTSSQMMKRFKIAFLLYLIIAICLLAFLAVVPVYGQGYQMFRRQMERIAEETRFQIGPFRIYPAIRLRNIGYDDNVYRQRKIDNPVTDFTGTAALEVRAYVLFRNYLIFSLSEIPEYVYYFEQKRERAWNNTFSSELRFLFLNRFVISGRHSYIKARRRPTSEFDVRTNVHQLRYSGSLFYETSRRTSFGIAASYEDIAIVVTTTPEDDVRIPRALDREEISGYFEFYYRIFSESQFFLNGGYTEYKFKYTESGYRNSYSYQVYSGIQFPLLGRLRGTFSLGYKRMTPERRGRIGFSGLVGNTGLNLRIKRFSFRFRYERDTRFSYWTENIFYLEDLYGTGISYYITRFLRLDYDFNYRISYYPEGVLLRMPDEHYQVVHRKDYYHVHTIGLVLRIIRNTGIGVSVNIWDRDSNINWVTRDRMFVGVSVTQDF